MGLPKHCPGHQNHRLAKVAPEEMIGVLRGSLTCNTVQLYLLQTRNPNYLQSVWFCHLQMLLSLLGLCFKRCNKNPGTNFIWCRSTLHCLFKTITVQDLHRNILTSIYILHLLHRKAAVLAISEPPANFKYVSIIRNHTVGTAGLNSFRAIAKSTKQFKLCKMCKQHSKY